MSLLGLGAVAIWHDITPEGRADFYAWHGREHMPERVAVPGFLRGRRYVAVDADLEFFNLYETGTPEVLTGDDYMARLNAPTPWTQTAVQHFRHVARSLCRVAYSHGFAQGGLVATWRCQTFDPASHHAEATKDLLCKIGACDGIAGAHWLTADSAASTLMNAEERARGRRNDVPGSVLIIEGWGDVSQFSDSCQAVITPDALKGIGVAAAPRPGVYQLQATVSQSDLNEPGKQSGR